MTGTDSRTAMTTSDQQYLSHKPIGYSYRVEDRIYAGEYPVSEWDQGVRMSQLRLFTDFGITDFLDLTPTGEMPPYEQFLPSGVRRHTFPIPNWGVPESVGAVCGLFDRVSAMLEERPGMNLYIHCHGGVGRTGTIVACWYIYRGMDFDAALAQMRRRFATNPRSAWSHAPENQLQLDFIREFAAKCR